MKTEELIVALAREAGAVWPPVAPLGVRLVRWLVSAALAIAAVVLYMRPRADFLNRLGDLPFLATTGAVVLLALLSAIAALSLSVPDDRRPAAVRAAPLVAAAGWALLLLWQLSLSGSLVAQLVTEPMHTGCLIQIAVTAIVPALVLVRAVRTAAPLDWMWTGVFAVAAGLAAGALGSTITCPIDRIAHQAWWHLLPVVALALSGLVVGARWLDRLR